MNEQENRFFFIKVVTGDELLNYPEWTKLGTISGPPRTIWAKSGTTGKPRTVYLADNSLGLDDSWGMFGKATMTLDEAKKSAEGFLRISSDIDAMESSRKTYYYQVGKYPSRNTRVGGWYELVKWSKWRKDLYGSVITISNIEGDCLCHLGDGLTSEEAKRLAELILIQKEMQRFLSDLKDRLNYDDYRIINNGIPSKELLSKFYDLIESLRSTIEVIDEKSNTNS